MSNLLLFSGFSETDMSMNRPTRKKTKILQNSKENNTQSNSSTTVTANNSFEQDGNIFQNNENILENYLDQFMSLPKNLRVFGGLSFFGGWGWFLVYFWAWINVLGLH